MKTITDAVNAAFNESFTYDELHRLTAATGNYGALTYAYNPIGNMTCNSQLSACSATSANYTYPASGAGSLRPHAVTTAGSNTYAYDANGNLTSGAGRTLAYDGENRPTRISLGASTASLTYDYAGARVSKSVNNGVPTQYVGALYECSTACSKYVFVDGTRVALKSGSTILLYHANHLGSTHVVANWSGTTVTKVEEIHYRPFGSTWTDTGSTSVTRKYTGQELDVESGLYYYGARYYDPVLARFVSADPIGISLSNPQTLNRYSYVTNNPINLTDPTGYCGVSSFGDFGDCFVQAGNWINDNLIQPVANFVSNLFGGGSGAGVGGFVGGGASASSEPTRPSSDATCSVCDRFGQQVERQGDLRGLPQLAANFAMGFRCGTPCADAKNDPFFGTQFMFGGSMVLGTAAFRGAAGLGAKALQWIQRTVPVDDGGMSISEDAVLGAAERWLGSQGREIAPDVYRSADELRGFRMTGVGKSNPYVNFEAYDPVKGTIYNTHVNVVIPMAP